MAAFRHKDQCASVQAKLQKVSFSKSPGHFFECFHGCISAVSCPIRHLPIHEVMMPTSSMFCTIMQLTTDVWRIAVNLPFMVAAGRSSTAGGTDVRDTDNGKDTSGGAGSPHA